jgi:hypothetical protein
VWVSCFASSLLLAILGISISTAGCFGRGGSSGETVSEDENETDAGEQTREVAFMTESGVAVAADAELKSSKSKARPSSGKATTRKSRTIDGIPIDLWFDDPLAVAADKSVAPDAGGSRSATAAPVALAATPAERIPPAATPPAKADPDSGATSSGNDGANPGDESAAASGGDDWASLITGDLIKDEIKRIRKGINDSTANVGQYNKSRAAIKSDANVLATLAVVAAEHPENFTWKRNAKYVRDLSKSIADMAKELGQKGLTNVKRTFEDVQSLIDGNTPARLEEAPDSLPIGVVTSTSGAMVRIDLAHNWMKSSLSTEAAFKKEADRIQLESAVSAVLGKAIAAPGAPNADDEEYIKLAVELIEANRSATQAAKEGDYAAFMQALDRSTKSCSTCHLSFRTN